MFLLSFVIFWCKKNGILTLKNEMLKQADFASKWWKSRFRGLKISKFSGGGCRTPYRGPPSAPPLFEPPMLKTWIRARGGQLETLKPAPLVLLKPRWPSIYSKHLTILFYSPLNKLCWPFPKKIIFLIFHIHIMISNPLYQKYYLQGHTPSLKLLAVPWQIHLSVMKHW